MHEISVSDDYLVQVHHTSDEACVADVVHITKQNGATLSEAVGRVVAHKNPGGAEHRPHWSADLFLTRMRVIACQREGEWQQLITEARSIPSELPDQIAKALMAKGILTEPAVLWVQDYSPLRDITVGNIYDDD